MDGIRKWLTACGAAFGVREVHPYRWADAPTDEDAGARPEVPYLVYTPRSIALSGGPLRSNAEVDGYDVTMHSAQQAESLIRVDLYASEFGLLHLAWCAIAAEKEQAIKNIFDDYRMSFVKIDGDIEEKTRFDAASVHYHQRMDVIIRFWVDYGHFNRNHKVDTVVTSTGVVLE